MPPMSSQRWFKGNLHTHSTNSDGDTGPSHVAAWYGQHGYDFLVLSDHNHLTVIEDAAEHTGDWPMLLLGEEVTLSAAGRPIHLNGIGIKSRVEPVTRDDVAEALQANVDLIRAAGGLASINHPNYKWAFDDRAIQPVEGVWAFEVFNGHPATNNSPAGGRPGTEQIWDRLLTGGKRIFGVATDDAHHFKGEFGPERSNPGRGWVWVESESCTPPAIMSAFEAGRFYASTGVRIGGLRSSTQEIVLEIDPRSDEAYTVTFVGSRGRELWRTDGTAAHYRPSKLDTYVRAVVHSSRGATAWTQPVFISG